MRLRRPLPTRTSAAGGLALIGVLGLTLSACADEPDAESGSADPSESTSEGSAAAPAFPVEISSCGRTTTVETAPTSAITLNQGATEVALALGVQDQLAGTAYLDDAVQDEFQAAYDTVPVISKEYPSREELLAAAPDFVYASYSSAFDAKVAGTQDELEADGIGAYLSSFGCEDKTLRAPATFESVWTEIDNVAAAFGVPDRAEALRAEQQAVLDDLAADSPAAGLDIFWYDSGDKAPFAGVGQGGPQLVIDAIGGTNIFADVEGSWAEVSWEDVIAADPDLIVFADAGYDRAKDRIAYLKADPVLSKLRAVQEELFATVPFSESTAGVRLVDGAVSVADQFAALADQ